MYNTDVVTSLVISGENCLAVASLHPTASSCYTQILRVLANIAHKKRKFCVQLAHLGLLSALCATLKMADQEMVTLSMDVLLMLVVSSPQVNQSNL